ncbi:hypothetical protein BGZ60DRAFT_510826 [Tricladium varicosporioides]|nr:hypothetical protein BGZ60DRAFT_510826 [Hymenoscyphus varicosporioides]
MCIETRNTYARCSAAYSHVVICVAYVETFSNATASLPSSSWTAINVLKAAAIPKIHTSCPHYQQVTRKLAGGCCSCLVNSRECFQDGLHFDRIFTFQERIVWNDPNVKEAGREYYEWRQAVGWVSGESEIWQNTIGAVPASELVEREVRGIILEQEKFAWERYIGPERAEKKACGDAKIKERLQLKKKRKQVKKEERKKRKEREQDNVYSPARSKAKLETPTVIDLTQDDSDEGKAKGMAIAVAYPSTGVSYIRTSEEWATLVEKAKVADLEGLGPKKHKKMINRWSQLTNTAKRTKKSTSSVQYLNELIMEAPEDVLRQAELNRQLHIMSLAK